MQFMANFNLQYIIPFGTIIYLTRSSDSIINFIFVLEKFVNNLESYNISSNDYGLNHKFL